MNKFQNKVLQLAIKREEEEFDDFVEMVETEVPGEPWIQVDFIHKDEEGYKRWNLRSFKEIKREVKAELRKGPKL